MYDVEAELVAGADVKKSDNAGWSALHLSALNPYIQAIEVLLSYPEVDVNSKNSGRAHL